MLRACLGSAVALVVPGAATASLLRLRLRSLATWAAIPAFSLAVVFGVAEVLDLVRLPFNIGTASVVSVALAGLAFARRGETRSAGTLDDGMDDAMSAEAETRVDDLSRRIALGMLVLAIGVGIIIWFRGVDGHGLVPPQI